jgi:hypothetical protein
MAKSAWFNMVWNDASGALVLPPNIKFVRADGTSAPIFMPVILFAFGDENRQSLVDSGLGTVR